jgi:hypothetical protein
VFRNSRTWKNLIVKTCTASLWEGERHGTRVVAWGAPTIPLGPSPRP